MAQQGTGQARIWIWLVVGVILAILLFVIIPSRRSRVPVRVVQVEREDLISTLSTNGKIEPQPDYQPRSSTATAIQNLYVNLDQPVARGQELLRLDDSVARKELAEANATLASALDNLNNLKAGGTADDRLTANNEMVAAQSQLRQNQAALKSLQTLQTQGAASANEVTAAQQQVNTAQTHITELEVRRKARYSGSDVAAQQAAVDQARATVAAAQSALAGVDVRAPFAGTIYYLPVQALGSVQPGDILLGEGDLSHLLVHAYFDEPEIGKLATGQPVKIVWDAKPNSTWHGHIVQPPSTIIDHGTRNVGECLISVDDPGGLLPNTNVTVTVTLQQRNNVLSLPREALHTDGARNFVYRIVDGRLQRASVQVGAINLTRFEVVSGLNAGDEIVLSSLSDVELRDRLRVNVQP
jgi:HlyD family secretion protein